jgi:hypothetical protein
MMQIDRLRPATAVHNRERGTRSRQRLLTEWVGLIAAVAAGDPAFRTTRGARMMTIRGKLCPSAAAIGIAVLAAAPFSLPVRPAA